MQPNEELRAFKELCEEFHSHYKLNREFLFESIKDISEPEINKLEPKVIGISFLLYNCVALNQKSFYAYIMKHEDEKGITEIYRAMKATSKMFLDKSGNLFFANSKQLSKEQIQAEINLELGRNSMGNSVSRQISESNSGRRKSTLAVSNQLQKSQISRAQSMKIDQHDTIDSTSLGDQEKKNTLVLGSETVNSIFCPITLSNQDATMQSSNNALHQSNTRESASSNTSDLNLYTNLQRQSSFFLTDKGINIESSDSTDKVHKSRFLKKFKSTLTTDDYQNNEEMKQLSKLKRQEDFYVKNYGLNTVKVEFMFLAPNIPEIQNNLKKLPVFKESPKDKDVKFDTALLMQWRKEYILITGEFHKRLLKAYLELLEKKVKTEVDFTLNIHKDQLDLCVKMKFNEDTGEIISKFRRINNMKDHEIKRQIKKRQKDKTKKKSKPKKYFPLKIKAAFRGPQIQCNTISVWKDEDDIVIEDHQIVSKLCEIRMAAKEKGQDQLQWLPMGKKKLILAQQVGSFPYILNPENGNKMQIVKSSSVKKMWDYLDTLKHAQEFGTQSDKNYTIQMLDPDSFEYNYVAYKFGATFEGQEKTTLTIRNTLKKMASERFSEFQWKIKKIEKVINRVLFEKLKQELQSMLLTSHLKKTEDIVKHLFYGNSESSPETIYSSKNGLDTKVHLEGQKSYGAYLCDNSHQAHVYSYDKGNQKQMFMCLALTGSSAKYVDDENAKQPPKKPNFQERYDSVYLKEKGRFIIYDSSKIYPGYLITYK